MANLDAFKNIKETTPITSDDLSNQENKKLFNKNKRDEEIFTMKIKQG